MRRFLQKRYIFGLIALIVIGGVAYKVTRPKVDASIQTDTAKQQDLKKTVLATGQVTSQTDLGLNFRGSGIVQKITTKVGAQAKQGDILATLDQKDQAASLTQARGSLASAQANYNKVISGASGPDIDVSRAVVASAQVALDNAKASTNSVVASAQVALDNAKKSFTDTQRQQASLVKNSYSVLLNSGLSAVPGNSNLSTTVVTISGNYTGGEGSYKITAFNDGSEPRFVASGLESSNGLMRTAPVSLGAKGLYVQFSNTTAYSGDFWIVDIPNTKSASYTSNLSAYNSAVQNQSSAISAAQNLINSTQSAYEQASVSAAGSVTIAQSALDQANSQLALKQQQARPADVAAARAQILSASGQVQAASANLENTVIRAPSNGTITTVNIKVGEQAIPGAIAAIVLQDVDNLHVEANISEANIASVQVGQTVSFTFDALGPDRTFNGLVQLIDPASTVVSGVVNYKVTAGVDKLPEIKPGMTANMTILVGQKAHVLSIPQRAVLSHDSKKFVRVITDSQKKTYEEKEVTTGMDADGGLVEVVSGLSAGQEIVTFIAAKK